MRVKKGISLIVLVITIIVMIILAGAIFFVVTKNNPIKSANEAVVKQDFANFKDELDTYISSENTKNGGDFEQEQLYATKETTPSVNDILGGLAGSKYDGYVKIAAGKIVVSNLMPNAEYARQIVGNNRSYQKAKLDVIVTGDENATINGKNPYFQNPVIPVGFKAVQTSDATWDDSDNDDVPDGWNDGLVISDENGNEFVWVPVDGRKVPYEKWAIVYLNFKNTSDDETAIPVSSEKSQIENYGGFYIGRYEAGVPLNQSSIDGNSYDTSDVEGTPTSKKGMAVWTCINYQTAMSNSKKLCDNDFVKSGLVTGTQWDTTIKWIENSGINVTTDSRTWGNYRNSESPANVTGYYKKQTTGFSQYWKAKNIYDIAGNTWEWTSEIESGSFVRRGGCYTWNGAYWTPSSRFNKIQSDIERVTSFRISLFIL